ncbi:MAG: SPOR domain-containing protein [Candidatus Polarisedimenticolaceae bacterium]|nr:SPOR domain-containing protein [Candidatus Polarisedimenticolaceae bacterium]
MIRKTLRHLIFWLCTTTLLLTGCATTPDYSDNEARFDAAKEAFLKSEYIKAVHLFEPLAIRGYSQAQYTLGYLYYYGLGISQNSEVGKRWISSAAAKGDPLAIEALALISKETLATEKAETETVEDEAPTTGHEATEEPPIKVEATEPVIISEPVAISMPTSKSAADASTPTSKPLEVIASTHKPLEVSPTLVTEPQTKTVPAQQHWILEQPASNYTIQLVSLSNEAAAITFLDESGLSKPTHIFHYQSQGSARYGIIHGRFATYTEAKEALTNLPEVLAKASPWIRNFSTIQGLLQQP